MLPCTWALTIPMQQPLVCPNLLNYYPDLKSGIAYVDAVTAQVYCNQVVQVICQSNQFSSILNPVIIIPSMSGSFKGNGMNFDAYSTNIDLSDVINSIYPANMRTTYVNMQNISCFYQDTCNAVAVNGSSLRLSDSIPITSFSTDFTVANIGSTMEYSGVYYSSTINLVLLYPSNLAFNASGIDCNSQLPVTDTPSIATNSPIKMTPAPPLQAPANAPATSPPPPSPSSTDNTNTIIGAVVGSVAGLLALIVLFFVVKHFAQQHSEATNPPIRYTPLHNEMFIQWWVWLHITWWARYMLIICHASTVLRNTFEYWVKIIHSCILSSWEINLNIWSKLSTFVCFLLEK